MADIIFINKRVIGSALNGHRKLSGKLDRLIVEWYGNTDQNQSGCESRRAELFGNGAQINNFVSPKRGNGTVLVNIRSATTETYLVDIEIYNWANGPGCQ